MGLQIQDGKGRGFTAEVNAENELVVRAIAEPEIVHASGVLGRAYSWDSGRIDIDANDTMLFLKNTGSVPLVLDRCIIGGHDAIATWDIGLGAAITTPAGGTLVSAVNLNPSFSSDAPDSIARSDETAVADAPVVLRIYTAISESKVVDLSGIILAQNTYIQVNQEVESAGATPFVIIIGHFEEPS